MTAVMRLCFRLAVAASSGGWVDDNSVTSWIDDNSVTSWIDDNGVVG